MSEVQFLSVVDHPNLVKLLGYCSAETERGARLLLVYEYMANRSLDDHLFDRAHPPIPWKTRLEIILGAAQGLAYLHEGMEVKVKGKVQSYCLLHLLEEWLYFISSLLKFLLRFLPTER